MVVDREDEQSLSFESCCCCCDSFRTSLCIGNSNRRCEHMRTVIHKLKRNANPTSLRSRKELPRRKRNQHGGRDSSNSLPQECGDVFWLHMRKERGRERTHESRSLFFFFFSLPFSPSSYPLLRSIKPFGSMVVFFLSFFLSFSLAFSLCCFLFVRARQRR